ncbi:hypothetical protein BVG16_29050 [Paenibacillus selenitireducens]|uniref:Amidohydrolase-related domain-containing protein n=1 Tax=Paenibacillus selenitireducens TaxID=1324314 RepID=A0A1T2X0K5_9BACL|nr:hypothetical protein BVG16_29050 [Paenibacillus selenitireducens]
MTAQGICTLSEAWEMASTRPSTYLSLPTCEGLKLGAPADFVFFRKQGGHIQIRKTIKAGAVVYTSKDEVAPCEYGVDCRG